MPTLAALAAISPLDYFAAVFAWNACMFLIVIIAIIRAAKLPATYWRHGWWSKAAAVFLAWYFATRVGAFGIPLGAAAVIFHTYDLAKKVSDPVVPELPFAEGGSEAVEEERS